MPSTGRPTGRDDVHEALIAAATRQFSAKGMAASMRDIADDAGVNIGLIHRHIGNKDDLLSAVLERQVRDADAVLDGNDATDTIRALVDAMPHLSDYVRIMAWRLLAGEDPSEVQASAPVLRAIGEQAGSDDELIDLLSGLALIYGWVVFGPQLLAGAGRPDIDPAVIRSRVRDRGVELGAASAVDPDDD